MTQPSTSSSSISSSPCNLDAYNNWYHTPFNFELYPDLYRSLLYKIQTLTREDTQLWKILHMDEFEPISNPKQDEEGDGEKNDNNDNNNKINLAYPPFYNLPTPFLLSNGQTMELSGYSCQTLLRQLKLEIAGDHGPVSPQSIFGEMCHMHCLFNDELRQQALDMSQCTCLQLSSQKEDLQYHKRGDWCHFNSGRLLCTELERCGIWNCRLEDFHCPRREYDRMYILGKGLGGDCSAGYYLCSNFGMIWCGVVILCWYNIMR